MKNESTFYEDALYISFIVFSIRLFPSKARISSCQKKILGRVMKNRVNCGNISQSLPCHQYRLSWGVRSYLTCLTPPPQKSEKITNPNQCTTNFGKCLNVTMHLDCLNLPPTCGNFMTFITNLVITQRKIPWPAPHLGNAPGPSR